MEIAQRVVGDVVIVEVSGHIAASAHEGLLQERLDSLARQRYRRVVLDLGGVSYVDSTGLGQLVHAYAKSKKAGSTLKLMRLTKRLESLLAITKLLTVFDTYQDEPAALASFLALA